MNVPPGVRMKMKYDQFSHNRWPIVGEVAR